MRVAVVSDIHGNRPAFEAALREIAILDPDEVWCLGDLVGYGAEPDACVALAKNNCDLCLVGNHDLAVRGDIPLTEFSRGAALAAHWTREHIAEEAMDYLRTLDPQSLERTVGLYHASPRDPIWEYVLSTLLAEMCMDTQDHRVCLVGHSHVALAFRREEGKPATGETSPEGVELDLNHGEWLLNPGSVGQPRDGDPRAAWLELDTVEWRARYRRTEYDIDAAAGVIRDAKLPETLAERLYYGQ